MSDLITDTIAAHQRVPGVMNDMCSGCNWLGNGVDKHAAHVLAALKAQRIAAVELPESAAIEVIAIEFWDGDGQEPVEAHITVAVPEEWEPNRSLSDLQTPEGMRVLAAVLLAQADADEAVAGV